MTMTSAAREIYEESTDEMRALQTSLQRREGPSRTVPAGETGDALRDMIKGRRAIIVADRPDMGDQIVELLRGAGLTCQRLCADVPIEIEDDHGRPRVRDGDIIVLDAISMNDMHGQIMSAEMLASSAAVSDLISSTRWGGPDLALMVTPEDALLDATRIMNAMMDQFVERMIDHEMPGVMSDRALDSLFGDRVIERERRMRDTIVLRHEDDCSFGRMAGIALKMASAEDSHQSRFDNDAWNKRQGRGRANMRGHGKSRR